MHIQYINEKASKFYTCYSWRQSASGRDSIWILQRGLPLANAVICQSEEAPTSPGWQQGASPWEPPLGDLLSDAGAGEHLPDCDAEWRAECSVRRSPPSGDLGISQAKHSHLQARSSINLAWLEAAVLQRHGSVSKALRPGSGLRIPVLR